MWYMNRCDWSRQINRNWKKTAREHVHKKKIKMLEQNILQILLFDKE